MEPSLTCTACGTTVGLEEVAQGLAVKVSGRLLCPLCLDRLPGDAQVLINQMRALRGMAVRTYRFRHERHPNLSLFTFTTSALVLAHLRRNAHGEPFEAPPLPPPGSRPRLPTASEAARGSRVGWFAVAGIAILIGTGIVWLVLPAEQPPLPASVPAPTVAPPPIQRRADDPARLVAVRLSELENRLRVHPEQARAIANEAELLRGSLEPRLLALRNRAEALQREATARIVPEPPPAPGPPAPAPEPSPVVPVPPQEPAPPAPAPEPPAPEPPAPETPAPVIVPALPTQAEPTPAPTEKPPTHQEAVRSDIVVVWPKGAKPLLDANALPLRTDLPWPWPTGESLYSAAMDGRTRQRRVAIDVRLSGVAATGGVTLVVHPGKADRTALLAIWSDGTTSSAPLALTLTGLRWQTVAIPASGTATLDPGKLVLRLEDAKELNDQRPFLIGGASTRADAAPTPTDHPLRLPLVIPPAYEAVDGWSRLRKQMAKPLGRLLGERNFSFARAKVLLPLAKGQANVFRPTLRNELAQLLRSDGLPNGNPDDLPFAAADFANPLAGWPKDGMDDMGQYQVLVFGWRTKAWGGDDDLGRRVESLLGKMIAAPAKARRPTFVPVLAIGEVDRASAEERTEIDKRWQALALRLVDLGIPVIDLRSAQGERSTEEVQRVAAALLVDGLRQLDWLMKL